MIRSLLVTLLLVGLVADAVAQRVPRWIIGGEEDVGTQLGPYVDVVATPHLIVVLERDAPFLKVFSHDGKLLQRLGRGGAGPGEFGGPSGISYDTEGKRILVVDVANGRVLAYPVADTLLRPVLYRLERAGLRSICTSGSRIFGVVRNAPTIIRELQVRGDRLVQVAEFGEPRTAHKLGMHPLVRTRASDGPSLCRSDGRTLTVASRLLGETHTFDLSSHLQRTAPVPQFQPVGITVEADAMTISMPPGESQYLVDLVEWGRDVLIVAERQLRPATGQAEPSGYRVSVLAGSTPGPLGAVRDWRPVALISTGALCARNDPAPTLGLFAGRECP